MNLSYGYAAKEKRTEANSIVAELEQRYAGKESLGPYLAAVYSGLGEKDKAFEWLEKVFNPEQESCRLSDGESILYLSATIHDLRIC